MDSCYPLKVRKPYFYLWLHKLAVHGHIFVNWSMRLQLLDSWCVFLKLCLQYGKYVMNLRLRCDGTNRVLSNDY